MPMPRPGWSRSRCLRPLPRQRRSPPPQACDGGVRLPHRGRWPGEGRGGEGRVVGEVGTVTVSSMSTAPLTPLTSTPSPLLASRRARWVKSLASGAGPSEKTQTDRRGLPALSAPSRRRKSNAAKWASERAWRAASWSRCGRSMATWSKRHPVASTTASPCFCATHLVKPRTPCAATWRPEHGLGRRRGPVKPAFISYPAK